MKKRCNHQAPKLLNSWAVKVVTAVINHNYYSLMIWLREHTQNIYMAFVCDFKDELKKKKSVGAFFRLVYDGPSIKMC